MMERFEIEQIVRDLVMQFTMVQPMSAAPVPLAPVTVDASELFRGLIPTGIIAMWSGEVVDIPDGWALCDGDNGTPDLSGMFVVGYNANDEDYSTIGTTGGWKLHGISMNNHDDHDAEHDHGLTLTSFSVCEGGNPPAHTWYAFDDAGARTGNALGEPLAHTDSDNRPPYYVVAFIMKL